MRMRTFKETVLNTLAITATGVVLRLVPDMGLPLVNQKYVNRMYDELPGKGVTTYNQ